MSNTTYIIKQGDTLFSIAQRELGDGNRWIEIKKSDGTPFTEAEAQQLQPGQEIYLPGSDSSNGGGSANNGHDMVQEILDAHNKYRAEAGVPPLRWSDSLAANAGQWANQLAATGKFEHSGAAENLAQGSAGSFSVTGLVEMWGNEKQHFTPGTFPNVSDTGNWADVGHYTQVVWRNTTEVGCGLASGNGNDVLVCHYNPAGNLRGQNVF